VQAEMPSSAVPNVAILLFAPQALILIACFAGLLFAVWHYPDLYHRYEATRETLTTQNRELKELDHAKSEFLANVSHDLWTPLASMEMSLSGLLDPQINWRPEQVRERLHLANHELSQLINRVRNLLEMARLNANADMGQKEPCDLTDSVGSALERLSPLLQDRDVSTDFPAYPLMFMCRHAQFEIVFMNLLDNAIKYSPPGSPIFIHGERRGRDIIVTVRDCGIGVEPQSVDLIFQQFYRADRTNSKTGSGLGLAICKAVVELHGGVIGVRNPPGGGAEFWLSVPAMPKDRLD
jgi:signal transduction histidine kinase